MHIFSPDQTSTNLFRPLLEGADIIWFGFYGMIVICVGLICLNFRARLLSRTNWKEKHEQQQQGYQPKSPVQVKQKCYPQRDRRSDQSTSRPLPVPNPVSSDCHVNNVNNLHRNCNGDDLDDILQSPQIIRPPKSGHLPNNMTKTGYGCPFESGDLQNNDFRYNIISSCQVDRSTGNSPSTSETSRVKRIFHIPNWASKLLQYLTDLRSPSPKTQSSPTNEVTKLQPSTTDTSSSGCSSGSSVVSNISTTATGASSKPVGYDRFNGEWSSWCLSPSHFIKRQNIEGVLCSELRTVKIPFDPDCCGVAQIPCSTDDLVSLGSDAELIDPVYSKIHSPSFADPVPSDYDSVIDSDDWSIPPNTHRGSVVSYSSEGTDHASTHIYHQLVKRDTKPANMSSVQPTSIGRTQRNAKVQTRPEIIPNPSVERNSITSIRPSRPSPLRRVIDCVISSRSSESITRTWQNVAPPQLPDRTYGQSTVNLVYRLRTLLRYREGCREQAVSVCDQSGSQHVKKAATLTILTHRSSTELMQPSVALSCTNMNGDQTAIVCNMHRTYDKDPMQIGKRILQETGTDELYSSSGNVSEQCYPSVIGINSIHYPEYSLDSVRQENAHFQQARNPTLCLQI